MTKIKKSSGLKTENSKISELSAQIDFLTVTIDKVNELSADEQIKWFEAQQSVNNAIALERVNVEREKTYFLGGSNVLAMLIYNNSVKGKVTTLSELWNEAQTIKNAKGETTGMTYNAFTRTFNTSIYTLAKNKVYNLANIDKAQKIEVVSYFDGMYKNITKLSDKFEFAPVKSGVLVNTIDVTIDDKKVFGKNKISSQNTFFVLPFALPTLKRYLELKGATAEKFHEAN